MLRIATILLFALFLASCMYEASGHICYIDGVPTDNEWLLEQCRENRLLRATAVVEIEEYLRDDVYLAVQEVSRTGAIVLLNNRSIHTWYFSHGFELAFYDNGIWRLVPYRDEHCFTEVLGSLPSLPPETYGVPLSRDFIQRFGELAPGRYKAFINGWIRANPEARDFVYAMTEFEITEDTPQFLSHLPPRESATSAVILVEYSNITPTGMTIIVENISPYNINHPPVWVLSIAHEDVAAAPRSPLRSWHTYSLPRVGEGDYTPAQASIPVGGNLEISLNWGEIFGELQSGEYRIAIGPFAAQPPTPTGWNLTSSIEFTIIIP